MKSGWQREERKGALLLSFTAVADLEPRIGDTTAGERSELGEREVSLLGRPLEAAASKALGEKFFPSAEGGGAFLADPQSLSALHAPPLGCRLPTVWSVEG